MPEVLAKGGYGVSDYPDSIVLVTVGMCEVLGSKLCVETFQMLAFLGEVSYKSLAKCRNLDAHPETRKVQ